MSHFSTSSKTNVPLIHVAMEAATAAAETVFRQVFREDCNGPGHAILILPTDTGSKSLRGFMAALKQALSDCYWARWGKRLKYLSLGRFDQQTTTKLHLDGAPEISLLMLGHEPTTVRSELQIAD